MTHRLSFLKEGERQLLCPSSFLSLTIPFVQWVPSLPISSRTSVLSVSGLFFRSSLQKNSSKDPSRLTFTSSLSLLKSLESGFRSHYSAGRALARSPVTPHCKCDSTSTVSPQFSSQLSAHFTPSLLKHFLPWFLGHGSLWFSSCLS